MADFIDQTKPQEIAEHKRKSDNRKTLTVISLCSVILFSFICGFFTFYFVQNKASKKLSEIIQILEHNTETEKKLSDDEVARLFVETYLKDDPYAKYYTEEEYEEEKRSSMKGNLGGFGMSVSYIGNETAIVYKVWGNSPAEKAGLLKGDILMSSEIEGVKTYFDELYTTAKEEDENATLSSVLSEYLNTIELDKTATFTVKRGNTEKEIIMKKAEFTVSYVTYYDNQTSFGFYSEGSDNLTPAENPSNYMSMLEDDTAYIRLTDFEGGAAEQFASAYAHMKEKGKTKLILDLRDNGGGYMNILQSIASYLIIPKKDMTESVVSYVRNYSGNTTSYATNRDNFNYDIQKIVILANENTASASECLIGAMMYYDGTVCNKGSLLITKNSKRNNYSTYGKGIMQTTYELLSGGAIKLTTAKIYQPNNETCIQDKGIVQGDILNQITDETAISRAKDVLKYALPKEA